MSDVLTLAAEARDRAGKGASRAVRREGRVPAVIYGNKESAVSIHVEEKLLVRMLNTGHFMNSVVEIELDGHRVLSRVTAAATRELQLAPGTQVWVLAKAVSGSQHAMARD